MIARVALLVAVLAPCLGGATKTTPEGSAAIVELRDHARLAAVVAQARTALPLDWIVHVFHGELYCESLSGSALRMALRVFCLCLRIAHLGLTCVRCDRFLLEDVVVTSEMQIGNVMSTSVRARYKYNRASPSG